MENNYMTSIVEPFIDKAMCFRNKKMNKAMRTNANLESAYSLLGLFPQK